MKRLVLFALAIVSAFTLQTAVKAQEFAPLIQPETVAVTRINLDKIDSSALSSQAEKIANAAIDFFVTDADQAEETKQAVPLIKLMLAQYLDTYIQPLKDSGVVNIYAIVDKPENPDEVTYPYLAIPTTDLTADQLKAVREIMGKFNTQLNSTIKYRFVRNNFFYIMIVPAGQDNEDEVKAYVKKHFQKPNTVEKAEFAEGFEEIAPDAAIATVSIPVYSEEEITNVIAQTSGLLDATENPFGDEFKECLQRIGETVAKFQGLVRYTVTSFNLDDLEIVQKNHMNSDDSTSEWRDLCDNVLDQVFATLSQVAKKAVSDEDLNPRGVTLEEVQDILATSEDLTRACTATTVEDNVIVWKMDEQFWSDKKPLIQDLTNKISTLSAKYAVPNDADAVDADAVDADAVDADAVDANADEEDLDVDIESDEE